MGAWYEGMSEKDLLRFEQTPTTHLVISGKEIEVHRCDTDGGVVLSTQASLARHPGHKIRQPVLLTREEVDMIVEGVID